MQLELDKHKLRADVGETQGEAQPDTSRHAKNPIGGLEHLFFPYLGNNHPI